METISWTDRVRNEEVLHKRKERNTVKRRKGNWIGYIQRKNCFLKHIIKEKMEVRI
jgi:hypothetical protein